MIASPVAFCDAHCSIAAALPFSAASDTLSSWSRSTRVRIHGASTPPLKLMIMCMAVE